ncbi:hypothetical protein BHE74_00011486 [Ensete ventricosum]|nr:hypothetical protein GW17_00004348 [Ensete ventricosum]RWW80187.1 hypothetical protein BHE74_00011486 [Ensete ventricosum]RZR86607.1 hypothetical protein BHM03_00013846 [Ensete ventricosum]
MGDVHQLRLWWRRRWGTERRATVAWVFAALFIVLFLAAGSRLGDTALGGKGLLARLSSDPALVDLTLVRDAEENGAGKT